MEQQTNEQEDWRAEVSSEPKATLKVADKEVVTVSFAGEGEKKKSADYGESVVFPVVKVGTNEELNWYVNAQNYDLLRQLKELGTLKGQNIVIKRIGSKKSDTRYTVEKAIVE